jgi:pyruvate, water dikinase
MLKWLNQVKLEDKDIAGGKNASLGEMIQNIKKLGIRVPDGFIVTTHGYLEFLKYNDLYDKISEIIDGLDYRDHVQTKRSGLKIRNLIQDGEFPKELENEILDYYEKLSRKYDSDMLDVAVRSSATAEDLPDASFAGQQETFLNIRGHKHLLLSIKNCFASLYTDRVIAYRKKIGYDTKKVTISVGIQKMVRSDLGSAGVAFSLDPDSGFTDAIFVNGSLGLGESVVGGTITPDEFILYKQNLRHGYDSILEKKLGVKNTKLAYGNNPSRPIVEIKTTEEQRNTFCISDDKLEELGRWVVVLEEYYSERHNKETPVDVEWAVDGLDGELYIVQTRPETVISRKQKNVYREYSIDPCGEKLLSGVAVGEKVSSGKVKIIYSLEDRDGTEGEDFFQEGDILVTDITTPDWENLMQKAGGIITNKGGRVCHASIIAREFGIPTIVGTGNATEILKNHQNITISCCQGDIGYVYNGFIGYNYKETNLDDLKETRTRLMLNVANPSHAFKNSMLPHQGVGLLRLEFIINNFVKVHPNALIAYDEGRLEDETLKRYISTLIRGFRNGEEYYITMVQRGVARIAAAFYPYRVIVRFSDFKSNEYKSLKGGEIFEPDEENPMIGWRGCSRYYSDNFEQAFGYECRAIKNVRNLMGLENVIVMLPFCRTVEEVVKVQDTMRKYGLARGENDLHVYLMCEIPSNIILGEEFANHVDGFSIGSNDLTQLTLGLDRDSGLVSHLFDERNPAVKKMISMIIEICKRRGKKIGICGQAPSDYPDFAKFLVEEGIDSISLIPDSLIRTKIEIKKVENGM